MSRLSDRALKQAARDLLDLAQAGSLDAAVEEVHHQQHQARQQRMNVTLGEQLQLNALGDTLAKLLGVPKMVARTEVWDARFPNESQAAAGVLRAWAKDGEQKGKAKTK